MDPNFLTKRSFTELKSMPFDSLYEGVFQQGQISQQLLQDFKLPMPQLSNIRSKHGALPRPAGSGRQRSTQNLPPPETAYQSLPPPENAYQSLPPPENAYHDSGMGASGMPVDAPMDATLKRPQGA